MPERFIDPEALQVRSLAVIELLKDAAENRLRTYPADIEAVLVFSGPGTYFDRLKPEEPEWMRWMDRDRNPGGGRRRTGCHRIQVIAEHRKTSSVASTYERRPYQVWTTIRL